MKHEEILIKAIDSNRALLWNKYAREKKDIFIVDVEFCGKNFRKIYFNNVVFQRCTFYNCKFENLSKSIFMLLNSEFFNCTFQNIDFKQIALKNNLFKNCSFNESKMVGNLFKRENKNKLVSCSHYHEKSNEKQSKKENNILIKKDSFKERKIEKDTKSFKVDRYRKDIIQRKHSSPERNRKHKISCIELKSKRSYHIFKPGTCYCCQAHVEKLHKFTNTSAGDILVCRKCQMKLIDFNFGKTDAMDRAYQGGGFSPR